MNTKDDVKNFMIAADQVVKADYNPTFDWQATLYMDLIKEEFLELQSAFKDFDAVEVADACADLIWVIEGLAHTMGIPMQKVWNEVARSNLSKVSESGKVIKREDGKILKPDTYSPPDIKTVLENSKNLKP
jgi:NTP pyrophosphatase (non-canonical NTP hydrolase)